MQKAAVRVEGKEEYMEEKANNKIFWKRGAVVREDESESVDQKGSEWAEHFLSWVAVAAVGKQFFVYLPIGKGIW